MKTKHLFWVILLSFWSSHLFGQDLYEVKFSTGGMDYKGLLVMFNESKMYMRVGYTDNTKTYRVVQVDYTSKHGISKGEEYLVLIGSNPKFITEKGKNEYNPDHLLFMDKMDKPWVIFDLNDINNSVIASSFTPLKKGNVTENYLRSFYKSNESDFLAVKRMLGIETPVSTPEPEPEVSYNKKATLHLVIIANTAISDIGVGCNVDKRNLITEFQDVANTLGIGFNKYIVEGSNFTKTQTLSTLNNLSVGSNDIVVFIYRGHGFRWSNQTETWPQMDLRTSAYTRLNENTTLSLQDAYRIIQSKGARLNIVLADCCNNDIGINKIDNSPYMQMQSKNIYDIVKLRKLFLETKGDILSCAASPGEYSWVNMSIGGFYTVSFMQSLREESSYMNNGTPSWTDILNNTITSAKNKTNMCRNCSPQNGKYYANVK
ncbi:MAG: hypothetical protein HC803_10470 [Saprospiraceae bacterium]|nr:hypothetical protein [Saprospiraceae bacterium]